VIFVFSFIESSVVVRLFVHKYYIKNTALHNTSTRSAGNYFRLCEQVIIRSFSLSRAGFL